MVKLRDPHVSNQLLLLGVLYENQRIFHASTSLPVPFPGPPRIIRGFNSDDSTGPPILVGHVTLVEGQLLRYVPEEQDWAATVKDAPFGLEDTLYTTKNSRAEIILPNRTWIRINGQTQIQLIAAQSDLTEVDVFTGTARFYHQGSQGIIKTFTPFGYVLAPAGAVFDLLVGENSVEVFSPSGGPGICSGRFLE